MKKTSIKMIALLVAVVMLISISITACDKNNELFIVSDSQSLSADASITVKIEGVETAEEYDVTFSEEGILTYDKENSLLSVTGVVESLKEITMTVSLVSNPEITASKVFTVAPSTNSNKIIFTADSLVVSVDSPAQITIATPQNKEYTVTYSVSGLVVINNGQLKVVEAPEQDTTVKVTLTLKSDPLVTVSKEFTVKAKEVAPVIKLKANKTELKAVKTGETADKIQLTVETATGYENDYVITASSDKVKINADNTVVINGTVNYDTRVSITAKIASKPEVTSSVSIVLRALKVDGVVNSAIEGVTLTTAKVTAASNAKITAEGTVKDYYVSTSSSSGSTSTNTSYDTTVKMEDGKWVGSWKISGKSDNTILTDMYVRGTETINYAYDKTTKTYSTGKEMLRVYIGKDNTVVKKRVTTYESIPTAWENQHLYNPIEHFATNVSNNFEYRDDFDVSNYGQDATKVAAFKYKLDTADYDDLYNATYLSFAFTPMMDETLVDIYFLVDKDGIVGIVATTEHTVYGTTDEEGNTIDGATATGYSYTELSVTFSGIGTTTVADPTPYTAKYTGSSLTTKQTLHNAAIDALDIALTKMKGATNYTFRAVDVTTYEPTIDADDYQIDSSSASNATGNTASSTGEVGTVGYITTEGILLGTTGKYTYSMDGNDYHTTYTGYKKTSETTYDKFEYSSKDNVYKGTKQYKGVLKDIIPQFNFSSAVFEYVSVAEVEGSEKVIYCLALRDATVATDLAPEISMYQYADDAAAEIDSKFYLYVDEDGNLVRSTYQYSLVLGTYQGYVNTYYTNVGTTTLPADTFTGYIERTPETSWADMICEEGKANFLYLHTSTHSETTYGCVYNKTTNSYTHGNCRADCATILKHIFGSDFDFSTFPTPKTFYDVFGDNLYVAEYKDREIVDADGNYVYDAAGNKTYIEYFGFNLSIDRCDENGKIYQSDYETVIENLKTALGGAMGYTLSASYSSVDKDMLEGGSRYAVFNSSVSNTTIVIENNFSRYFWVSIYKLGDYPYN